MFIDEAEIHVKAGDGGNGAVTFRREAGVPRGGPSGGDGGDGGSIVFFARPGLDTLLDFRGRHRWVAESGKSGRNKDMAGPAGEDLVIDVPPGTLIYDIEKGVLLKDLSRPEMRVVIARAGKGGRGNARFATSTNQTPRFAEPGTPGEERHLRLELKLIADVGLVGLPNAGKSTLLSRLSAAHPKIADYPFTTLEPSLGIVKAGPERRFVMADLPGLIEGAHRGVGLGDEFLRHVERTRVLVHLVEVRPHARQTPAEAYRTIRAELAAYSPRLAAKPEIVVLTKADLLAGEPGGAALRSEFSREVKKPVIAISSATGEGLARLVKAILDLLDEVDSQAAAVRTAETAKPNIPTPPHLRPDLAPVAAGDSTGRAETPSAKHAAENPKPRRQRRTAARAAKAARREPLSEPEPQSRRPSRTTQRRKGGKP
jgi:GTP-binding protein